jgi:hypothetical protein
MSAEKTTPAEEAKQPEPPKADTKPEVEEPKAPEPPKEEAKKEEPKAPEPPKEEAKKKVDYAKMTRSQIMSVSHRNPLHKRLQGA